MREAASRTDPEGAIRVRMQGSDEVVRKTVRRGERTNGASTYAVEAVGCAHPQVAIGRSCEGKEHVAQQAVAYRVGTGRGGASEAQGSHPVSGGADPERACAILNHGGCIVAGQA